MQLGDWVRVNSVRPHKDKYKGFIGKVAVITNKDIVYVQIGAYTPNFYLYELEVLSPPITSGGAA